MHNYFFFSFFQHSDGTDDQKLEEEQDFMGLYESEISKQLHLRNRQRREWDAMRKKIQADEEKQRSELLTQQKVLEQEKRREDRTEIAETDASKKLAAAMVKSSRDGADDDDVLNRAVEVLRDQNGNLPACLPACLYQFLCLVKIFNVKNIHTCLYYIIFFCSPHHYHQAKFQNFCESCTASGRKGQAVL